MSKENKKCLIAGIDPGMASGAFVLINAFDKDRILATLSLKSNRKEAIAFISGTGISENDKNLSQQLGWGDKDFSAADIRAREWVLKVKDFLTSSQNEFGAIDYLAIESFVDHRSRAREEKNHLLKLRWQTPLVIGHLSSMLADFGFSVENGNLIYQDAGIVIRQMREEIGLLERRKDKTDGLVAPGDLTITNDHQRKALAHALALSIRINHKLRKEKMIDNER